MTKEDSSDQPSDQQSQQPSFRPKRTKRTFSESKNQGSSSNSNSSSSNDKNSSLKVSRKRPRTEEEKNIAIYMKRVPFVPITHSFFPTPDKTVPKQPPPPPSRSTTNSTTTSSKTSNKPLDKVSELKQKIEQSNMTVKQKEETLLRLKNIDIATILTSLLTKISLTTKSLTK